MESQNSELPNIGNVPHTMNVPRLCKHCNREAGPNNFHGLGSKIRKDGTNNVSVITALNEMFIRSNSAEELVTPGGLCNKCHIGLRRLHAAFTEFQSFRNEKSELSQLMLNPMTYVTDPGIPTRSTRSISVQTSRQGRPPARLQLQAAGTALKNFNKSVRGRKSIWNVVKKSIRREMRAFSKITKLREPIQPTDDQLLWTMIYNELSSAAPHVLEVLYCCIGKRVAISQESAVDPRIGTAFCVLAMARSQTMNRFQKTVGVILYSTMASKDVSVLHW